MTDVIKEMQEKIAYYYKRIDECNNTIRLIQDIENKKQVGTTKEGRKEGGYDGFNGDVTKKYYQRDGHE